MQTYHDLKDKAVLITGASSGIGAAAAQIFAASGARLALGWSNNEDGATKTAESAAALRATAIPVRADLRSAAGVHVLMDAVAKELGQVDILVNNAGSLIQRAPVREINEDLWDEVLNLNLKSALLCSQAVAPAMTARRSGSIINIVSIAGRNGGGPGASAYATAKGALITLTKAMAKELAPSGVRVNAVSPGVIDTPFHEVFSTPEIMKNFTAAIPLGRVGTAEEVGHVIAFLASGVSSYVVGETIEVNGGQLML